MGRFYKKVRIYGFFEKLEGLIILGLILFGNSWVDRVVFAFRVG